MADVDGMPALTRALLYAESFNLGIIPVTPYDDVKRALAQLPPDEARAAKRKFRKAWKKALKQKLRKVSKESRGKGKKGMHPGKRFKRRLESQVQNTGMFKGCKPSGLQVNSRRLLVFSQIMERVDATVERYEP